ncbi:DnaD domain protein [Alkalibacterium sp. MB6]|uniref:DnaD domain protein n=1 Tax=Alkalibacterium sp. MB6 TaxID=2081965 RepID=UPI00137968DC|nr:DnaD domain protein [Alkalibacterium sp. MB6]
MVKRIVDTTFWTDMSVIDNYSVEDKYFSLYLMTNGKTTQVGIYSLPKKVISFETGFTSDVIQVLIDRFSKNYGKIIYSEDTQEVTVLQSLQYTILKGGKPVSDLLERELAHIKDSSLIASTYEEMKSFWELSKRSFDKTIKQLFENELINRGLMKPQNDNESINDIEKEKENEIKNEKENDIYIYSNNVNHNDNDNEESGATNRIQDVDSNEIALQERYIDFIRECQPTFSETVTPDNILSIYYSQLIGEINPIIENQLNQWKKNMPTSLVLEALQRSLKANNPLLYAASILSNWRKEKVSSLKDVVTLDRHYQWND